MGTGAMPMSFSARSMMVSETLPPTGFGGFAWRGSEYDVCQGCAGHQGSQQQAKHKA